MGTKRVYLHIGFHKTGTTSIQDGLAHNHDLLLRHSYLYPNTLREGSGHHHLAYHLLGHPRYRPSAGTMEDLVAEITDSPAERVILSAENLSDLPRPAIRHLAEQLVDFEVTVVVYLRRQDLYLQSLWFQNAKLGIPLPDFSAWLRNAGEQVYVRLNYRDHLRVWEEIFDRNHVIVRPFEARQLDPDLVRDLLRTCHFPSDAPLTPARALNISPSHKTVNVLRRVAARIPMDNDRRRASRVYQKAFRLINDAAEDLGWNERTTETYLWSRDDYASLVAPLEPSNQEVARRYLGREELFLDAPPLTDRSAVTVTNDKPSGREILRLMSSATWKAMRSAGRQFRQGSQ